MVLDCTARVHPSAHEVETREDGALVRLPLDDLMSALTSCEAPWGGRHWASLRPEYTVHVPSVQQRPVQGHRGSEGHIHVGSRAHRFGLDALPSYNSSSMFHMSRSGQKVFNQISNITEMLKDNNFDNQSLK